MTLSDIELLERFAFPAFFRFSFRCLIKVFFGNNLKFTKLILLPGNFRFDLLVKAFCCQYDYLVDFKLFVAVHMKYLDSKIACFVHPTHISSMT